MRTRGVCGLWASERLKAACFENMAVEQVVTENLFGKLNRRENIVGRAWYRAWSAAIDMMSHNVYFATHI